MEALPLKRPGGHGAHEALPSTRRCECRPAAQTLGGGVGARVGAGVGGVERGAGAGVVGRAVAGAGVGSDGVRGGSVGKGGSAD